MFSEPMALLIVCTFFCSCLLIIISLLTMLLTRNEKEGINAAGIFLFALCLFVLSGPVPFCYVIFPLFTKCLLAIAAIIAGVSLAKRIGDRYLANTYRRAGA